MARISLSTPLLQATLRATRPVAPTTPQRICSSRSFSSLPTLRPSLTSPAQVFRARAAPPTTTATTSSATTTGESVLDLVLRSTISAHPGLAQIRCGPRPTLSGATRLVQKRRHGFLSRIRTAKGRKLLARRRAKGRKRMSA